MHFLWKWITITCLLQHRYYGESFPFGSKGQAFQNARSLGYLSLEQALVDYAQLIIDVKKNLSAENCPVIAVGGSYGGSKLWLKIHNGKMQNLSDLFLLILFSACIMVSSKISSLSSVLWHRQLQYSTSLISHHRMHTMLL